MTTILANSAHVLYTAHYHHNSLVITKRSMLLKIAHLLICPFTVTAMTINKATDCYPHVPNTQLRLYTLWVSEQNFRMKMRGRYKWEKVRSSAKDFLSTSQMIAIIKTLFPHINENGNQQRWLQLLQMDPWPAVFLFRIEPIKTYVTHTLETTVRDGCGIWFQILGENGLHLCIRCQHISKSSCQTLNPPCDQHKK